MAIPAITLAGAKRDPEGKDAHLPAMLGLAGRLRDAGATNVRALR
jgi:hypothetical protein